MQTFSSFDSMGILHFLEQITDLFLIYSSCIDVIQSAIQLFCFYIERLKHLFELADACTNLAKVNKYQKYS